MSWLNPEGTPEPPAPAPEPSPTNPNPPYGPQPTTSGKAISGLVLGILSCVPLFIFLPLAAIVSAVVALFLARSAKKDIEFSEGAVTGSGMVTAARVTAGIGLAGWGLFIVGNLVILSLLSSQAQSISSEASLKSDVMNAAKVMEGGYVERIGYVVEVADSALVSQGNSLSVCLLNYGQGFGIVGTSTDPEVLPVYYNSIDGGITDADPCIQPTVAPPTPPGSPNGVTPVTEEMQAALESVGLVVEVSTGLIGFEPGSYRVDLWVGSENQLLADIYTAIRVISNSPDYVNDVQILAGPIGGQPTASLWYTPTAAAQIARIPWSSLTQQQLLMKASQRDYSWINGQCANGGRPPVCSTR